jgi:hypothetical protein
MPTATATKPVAPKPVAPKPVAPKPVAPKPVAPKSAETPAAASATDLNKMRALEKIAQTLLGKTITEASKLAETLVALYPYKPWDAADKSAREYFRDMGIRPDNFTFPTDARRAIVKGMFTRDPKAVMEHVIAMTGAGEKTIKRDKAFLELVNPNRQDAHTPKPEAPAASESSESSDDAASAPAGKPDAPFDLNAIMATLDRALAVMDESQLREVIARAESLLDKLTAE